MGTDKVDFFISHAGLDSAWAEWVAWQLTDVGYRVELDVWDWPVGQNFVTMMSDALQRAERVVALFSAAYFDRSRYTTEEWSVSVLHEPGVEDRLVPLRVEDVSPGDIPAVMRPLMFRDLFGTDAAQARRVLLEAVQGPRRPDRSPAFPGRDARDRPSGPGGPVPRLPGSVPTVWNVQMRNHGFTGRDRLLAQLRQRLLGGNRAVVQALYGIAGVGKTQLAAEYAHRFAADYDLVWWIHAQPGRLIGDQLTALAIRLDCVTPDTGTDLAVRSVITELQGRGRWLLVFDNAEDPQDMAPWLPAGATGHVLITSQAHGRDEIAMPFEVDVFARKESMALLRARVVGLTDTDARRLAKHLGDLPLGIVPAAAFLVDTGVSTDDYLKLLATQTRKILAEKTPPSYPKSLPAVIQVAAEELARKDPPAFELVTLCAFLAPEPIPPDWFLAAAATLPEPLAHLADDRAAWAQLPARVGRSSLARIDQRGLQMHVLTQAILRDWLATDQADSAREHAGAILVANRPGSADDFATWPVWARMIPHLLAVDPTAAVHGAGFRDLACSGIWYLLRRGEIRSGHELFSQLREHWRARLGDDDPSVLRASNGLAVALRALGRYEPAKEVNEDTLARRRRIHGDDHRDTLISAGNLASTMRALHHEEEALKLNQDNLNRRRRLLGEDHPDTLMSATCVARDLHALAVGQLHAARALDEDALARRRRALGDDHPSTLMAALNLVRDLRALGSEQEAEELERDTEARQKRARRKIGWDRLQETEPEDV